MSDAMTEELKAIIEPVADAMGFEVVRISFGGGGRPILQVMAERPDGTMTVEDCTRLSRELSVFLDVENPVPGGYLLEVSSPGIDRPLTRLKDFERYEGCDAKLELHEPVNGQRRWRGVLAGVENDQIALADQNEKHLFGFSQIRKAKLVLTEALLAEQGAGPEERQ
jgi:ribosome maturation factor RimP